MKSLITCCALLASVLGASAQGYVIQRPGQLPTYVNPSPGGGYTMQQGGQMPTYINPSPGGGYTVQQPGQMPTFITPQPGPPPMPCFGFDCR